MQLPGFLARTLLPLVLAVSPVFAETTADAAPAERPRLVIASAHQTFVPPFNWTNRCEGQRKGLGHRRTARLLGELGYKVEYKDVVINTPAFFAAMLEDARQGRIDAYGGLPKGTAEDVFVYGEQPLLKMVWGVFYRAKGDWQYHGWQSLRAGRGLMVNYGTVNIYGPAFKEFASREMHFETTGDPEAALLSLQRGETDYVLMYRLTGNALLESLHLRSEIRSSTIANNEFPLYIAVARNSPLAQRMQELDATLLHYETSGLNQLLFDGSIREWINDSRNNCVLRIKLLPTWKPQSPPESTSTQ